MSAVPSIRGTPLRAPRHILRGGPSAAAAVVAALLCGPAAAEPRPSIAMHGTPLLAADFAHFAYADPKAPKGGRITMGLQGTFDQLNPFVVKGNPAVGMREGSGGSNVYESLMERSYDEPFTLYGLLAETIDVADDRRSVEFRLHPAARFSDRTPVTPEDVVFSLETLRDKGLPFMRSNYRDVVAAEKTGERSVRFRFADAENRELPLILGLMPILPAHAWKGREFEKTTLEPPIGSGPYVVTRAEPGSLLELTRDPDYWGRDLPVRRGLYNADVLRYEYYRDHNSLFEAFKKGLIDILAESDPARWSQKYDFPAVAEGRVVKEAFVTDLPKGMTGFVLNARRPVFSDVRVREALVRLYDFEWANKNLYFGLYRRQRGWFDGSELSFAAAPADDREKALLAPFPDAVRDDVLAGVWRPPVTDASGRDRAVLKSAFDLLAAAGWRTDAGRLVNTKTGEPLAFEILAATREHERLAIGYQRTLAALGIEARIRTVDAAQFEMRRKTFDFDMTLWSWGASASPGNEQLNRWTSRAAATEGSLNLPGVTNPAVDAVIDAMLAARSREDLVATSRALDRLLVSGFHVVPLFHAPAQWVAHWTRIAHPSTMPKWGWTLPAWWVVNGGKQ
ncbi:MAG: extracellular solute-binding protein [Siculibacillus sp.]|nr:extracellular solute-binding protein [Siculibacillus sp.]